VPRPYWALALLASLVVSLLGLVGTPPTAVFLGKLEAFSAASDGGYAWLAVVAAVSTVASLFSYLRWIAPAFLSRGLVVVRARCQDQLRSSLTGQPPDPSYSGYSAGPPWTCWEDRSRGDGPGGLSAYRCMAVSAPPSTSRGSVWGRVRDRQDAVPGIGLVACLTCSV
jgi:hypothetical protein